MYASVVREAEKKQNIWLSLLQLINSLKKLHNLSINIFTT